MKALTIVETAYRATLEEQDDPILWMNTAMKGGGADVTILLRGNAINYAVKGQDASGLTLGGKPQKHPPDLERDIAKLIDKGAPVYIVEEDVAERGLERTDLVDGLSPISRRGVAKLMGDFDAVWHW